MRKFDNSALFLILLVCLRFRNVFSWVYPRIKTHLPLCASTTTELSTIAAENRGDARGAALLLENVYVYAGSEELLQDISWRVEPRTKWALVGSNGAGKSTLLRAIIGSSLTTKGSIVVGNTQQVGYLPQTAVAGSTKLILEEASSGMTAINKAREAMERAQQTQDLDMLEKATERFEALGGYQQEQKVAAVLKGLGFTSEQIMTTRCDELSGGWQMRVAFARLLLSEPSLSLLDEPSNHLDAAAKKWLANYLANYSGAGSMILVTHDVELLQSMDHIAEINAGKLQIFKSCTYNQYLELKTERANAARTSYERNVEKAAKLQAFVDRFGASATKASAAQSRVKQLERMEREGLLDAPAEAVVAKRFKPSLTLPQPPKVVGESLLCLTDASIGYDKDRPLVSGVNLDLHKGMKLLIRGPNGTGKSCTLQSLRGTLPLLSGSRKENPTLRLGMFTQDLAQELDINSRAVDLATAYAREGQERDIFVSDEQARNVLGRLGLQGEKSLRKVGDLSGGEKARVALAMFALKPSNVYLFDEASNHLDTECVEALSQALSDWGDDQGVIVVVSHDRRFCEKIDFTHIATVANGMLTLEQRGARQSDWEINGMSAVTQSETGGGQSDPYSLIDRSLQSEREAKLRKQAYNAPKRIAKLEQLITEAEEKIACIDNEMLANGSDVGKLVDLNKEKEALTVKVEEYMTEWEGLELVLTEASGL